MRSRFLIVGLAVASVAWGGWQVVTPDPARVLAMHENWRVVNDMLAGVTRGDLDAVRKPAQQLAEPPELDGLPESTARHAAGISAAARLAADARDTTSAASAAAQLLTACGACHIASHTRPAVTDRGWPSVGGTVGHMLDHQRAADQMMRGLMVPSSTEWRDGARALRAAPLHAADLPRDAKLTPQLLRVEEAVHRLAEEAVAAETPQSRARVFSTLLARCADCHSLHRTIWGPK